MSDISMSLSPTPPISRSRSGSHTGTSTSTNSDSPLLYTKLNVDVNQQSRSPSYDALNFLTANVGSDDSYDDDDDVDDGGEEEDDTSSIPVPAKARRKKYQHHSIAGTRGNQSSSSSITDDELRKRKRHFGSTESEHVLSLSTPPLPTRRRISEGGEKRKGQYSGKLNVRKDSGDDDYQAELARRDMIRGRRIDKTTGMVMWKPSVAMLHCMGASLQLICNI